LLLSGARVDRVFLWDPGKLKSEAACGGGFAKQLKDEIPLTVLARGTDVELDDCRAALNVEFQGGHRRLGAIGRDSKTDPQSRSVLLGDQMVKHDRFPRGTAPKVATAARLALRTMPEASTSQRGPPAFVARNQLQTSFLAKPTGVNTFNRVERWILNQRSGWRKG